MNAIAARRHRKPTLRGRADRAERRGAGFRRRRVAAAADSCAPLTSRLPHWDPWPVACSSSDPPARSAPRRSTSSRARADLELVGLSAERSWETLVEQAARAPASPGSRSPTPTRAPAPPRRGPTARCSSGAEGLVRLVHRVGRRPRPQRARRLGRASGPTVATLGEGIDLALANKESLVVGGELVTQLAEATGARIIPVDSEHSALHQLLDGERAGHGRPARADRQRRPVPRPHARRARRRHGRGGPRSTRRGRWAARSRSTRRR